MAFWNKKKKECEVVDAEKVAAPGQEAPELDVVAEDKMTDAQPKVQEPAKPEREWIWVEGYKAVYSDMTAQKGKIVYEIGKTYEMPKEDVKECSGGFHLCRRLKDTFNYYSPFTDTKDTRYYKVKALVPKDRWELLPENDTDVCKTEIVRHYSSYFGTHSSEINIDKIAACAIIITEEVPLEQILNVISANWKDGYIATYPSLAKEFYLSHDFSKRTFQDFLAYILENICGFSSNMSAYIVKKDLYEKAMAFGSQSELTMSEKLQFIFNETK